MSCGTLIRMEQGAFTRQPRITPDARQVHDTAFQVQEYSSNTCVYDYIIDEYNYLAWHYGYTDGCGSLFK